MQSLDNFRVYLNTIIGDLDQHILNKLWDHAREISKEVWEYDKVTTMTGGSIIRDRETKEILFKTAVIAYDPSNGAIGLLDKDGNQIHLSEDQHTKIIKLL